MSDLPPVPTKAPEENDTLPPVPVSVGSGAVAVQDNGLPSVPGDVAADVSKTIAESEDPDWSRAVFEKATALNQVYSLPMAQAWRDARNLQDSPAPKPKKLGEAIVDRWNTEKITVQLGQLGNKAKQYADDPEKLAEILKQYDALEALLPDLEDVAPAYPDNVFGKTLEFLRQVPIGAVGLASQMYETIGGKEQYERMLEIYGDPSKFLKNNALIASQFLRGTGEVEGGYSFVEMVKAGVAPEIAKTWSDVIGKVNNAIEVVQWGTLLKAFPGAGAVVKDAVSKLTQKAIIGAIVKYAGTVAAGTASELAQEIAQEAVTFYGENLAIGIQNAAKGTDLEKNTGFGERVSQLVKDFLPGVLGMGMLSVGGSSFRREGKVADKTAAPAEAPANVATAREAVQKAMESEVPRVQDAKAALEQAETAQMETISNAEVLTDQMVNDAVELGEIAEEVAATVETPPESGNVLGVKLPEMTEAESKEWDQFANELTGKTEEVAAMPVITPEETKAAVEAGKWVEDAELPAGESWAKVEVEDRTALRGLATYLADSGQAATAEDFSAQVRQVDTEQRSDEYYQKIWESAPKTETVVDTENQKIDEDAEIEKGIAAEEKAVNTESTIEKEVDQLAEDLKASEVSEEDLNAARQFDRIESELQSDEAAFVQEDPRIVKLRTEIEDLESKYAEERKRSDAMNRERIDKLESKARDKLETQKAKSKERVDDLQSRLTQARKDESTMAGLVKDEWKNKLATYKEEQATKKQAKTDAEKEKKLRKRMIAGILKPPGAGIGVDAIDEILALQAPYNIKETKALNKTKRALTEWQKKHPGVEMPQVAKDILNKTTISDLPTQELIDLWKKQKDIRQKGAEKERARRTKILERRKQMATDLMAEIPGGYMAKRLAEQGTIATQEAEKKLAKKGRTIFDKVQPMRLFDMMGKSYKEIFWNQRKKWEGKEAARQEMHSKEISDLYKKHGVRPKDFLIKAGDSDYYIDTLLYYYGQMKDRDGRKAVLYGNDENEARVIKAIAELPQNYRDFLDDLQDTFNQHYGETRKVQVEVHGKAAPQVKNYLPMRREQDFGTAMAAELSMDANIRAKVKVAGLQKGFTNQRVTFKEGTQQSRVRTDLLNIIAEQITKESRYVAGEEWATDVAWLLGGKSKESKKLIDAVKQKWGKPAATFLQNYANAVTNPGSFNGADFGGVISRVFRNMNDAVLMYKLGTVLVQLEGPFRSLAALDFKQWPYVFNGLWNASLRPNKSAQFMYSKSPVMKAMAESQAIDPALQEGRRFRRSKTGVGIMVQQARNTMRDVGYAGLSAMNKWTITAEWTTVYRAELKKTGNDVAAVQAANDAIYKHQPSGNLADAPQMYWNAKQNILKSYLLRFSRASNQTAQMLLWDMPKNVKKGQIGKATGVLASFAIGAMLNGLRTRKRLPKDEGEFLEDGINGFADALDPLTYGAAGVVIDAIRGDRSTQGEIKPLESVYLTTKVLKQIAMGTISQHQIWDTLKLLGQMGGLPTPAAENTLRTFYDMEEGDIRFDPVELLGRRPKE